MNVAKLLIQVSTTESDFCIYKDSLIRSLKNVLELAEPDVTIYLVYQSRRCLRPDDLFFTDPRIKLHVTQHFGVSAARNSGLDYARSYEFDYIVFHDASIFFTSAFVRMINSAVAQGLEIAKGSLHWGSNTDTDPRANIVLANRKTNLIFDTCVCVYIFGIEALDDLTFNEYLGPGQHTGIKAGEDIIFLYQLFRGKVPFPVAYSDVAKVYHPIRPIDNSKHLAYAESQGVLVRWMLTNQFFNPYVLLYFFAFFGNALVRVLMGRRHSGKILVRRLVGFVDAAGKRKLIS